MATRICPDCGAQYVATVRRCIDCDVVLVDEAAPEAEGEATSAGAPLGDGDQVGYELDGWGNQLKVTLEGMLDRAGVPRAWEAGALVVSAQHEEVVDDLIATLEGDELPDLDDDVAKVALEIDGLDADDHDDLDARLLAQSVPHAWDDQGALVVAADDEERVLAIIEESQERTDEAADGLAASEVLTALYVAVDKLVKSPQDRRPATAFVRAAADAEGLGIPYGFGAEDWASLTDEVAALAVLVAPFADEAAPPAADADEDDADDAAVAVDEDEDEAEVAEDEVAEADQAEADEAAPETEVDPEVAKVAARSLRARLVDLV